MRRINHVVLYVSDLARSLAFYEQVLGFQRLPGQFPGGAFLRHAGSANDHDLGLFESRSTVVPAPGSVGLYHVAWEVDTLAELAAARRNLSEARAMTGAGDHGSTKALYGRDPDGIEFEVCWLVPDEYVEEALRGASLTAPLDLPAEIERYGANTLGGPRTDPAVWARVAGVDPEPGRVGRKRLG
ncbi:VOC family protein [Nocardia rhamnosiphila]|uniref:VOC family protein n=1 Tax=Nocardia rhamnosiphila TaxID=426716 RepID=UPI0033FB8E02